MEDLLQENVQRTSLRCRRCRRVAIDSSCLLTIQATDERAADVCSIWHVNVDTLPEWVLTSVHQAQWTAGKLNCLNCGARLGGFNFISRSECPCGGDASVHFSKSRLDYDHKLSVLLGRPLRSRLERGQAGLLTDVCQNKEQRPEFATTARGSLQMNRSAAMPHMSPAEASDLHTAGKTLVFFRPAVGLARSPTDEPRPSSVSYPTSQQLDRDGEASSTNSSSPLAQQLPQPEEDVEPFVEPSALHEEVSDPGPVLRRRTLSDRVTEQEEAVPQATMGSPASSSLSKREKNRLKSLRRKRRKRERWLHTQQVQALEQELAESLAGSLLDSEEEEGEQDAEGLTCAVCLDVYFSPYSCQPCGHVFCEPCLRTHAGWWNAAHTPCPLCRRIISNTSSQEELNQRAKTLFPKLYLSRKQNFETSPCAKWPLPHCQRGVWHPIREFPDYDDLRPLHFEFWERNPPSHEVDLIIRYIYAFRWYIFLLFLWLMVYLLF